MASGGHAVSDGGATVFHVRIEYHDVEPLARERPGGGEAGHRRSKYHHVMDHALHLTRKR